MSNTVRMMDPAPPPVTPGMTVLGPSQSHRRWFYSWLHSTHRICAFPFLDVPDEQCRSTKASECCYCGSEIGSR